MAMSTNLIIRTMSPMNYILARSAFITAILNTPIHQMTWFEGKIISPTLPSSFMAF